MFVNTADCVEVEKSQIPGKRDVHVVVNSARPNPRHVFGNEPWERLAAHTYCSAHSTRWNQKKAKPPARSWGSAPTSAGKRQAREPTPDLEDAPNIEHWWNQLGPQTNTVPDTARNNAQTYHIDKRDSALIRTWADQNTSRPPPNPIGATRPKAEADTNTTRGVPKAEPEDALRVRPQRTPIRQKIKPAIANKQRTVPP